MRHAGERAVQSRAGFGGHELGSATVGAQIPPIAAEFLRRQPMVVLGAADDDGAVWATMLTGQAGFVTALDERTVAVADQPRPGHPLGGLFDRERAVGLLAIEPGTRRRMRINGQAQATGTGLVVRTDQVYANCPKYIQTREPSPAPGAPGEVRVTSALTGPQRALIGAADTFFVATYAAGLGADASHRGGNPGFVQVTGPDRLTWPEYVGNRMFMTLGNLELDPRCGLLFPDWESGDLLHVTGRAVVSEDPERVAAVPGAQRLVDLDVDRVVSVARGSGLRWTFGGYFRLNPR
ncbi:pyridoxamine 5'-phosphate oxidase family protein [Longispora sp. NPDC051575]|uniref:pyridoxamine 5'-phosphate oxidase family protein n=1 Tax=Longispora sp. NPDC051575 TaxID=3154943 RepID=UPI00343E0F41